MTAFAAEWMDLEGFFDAPKKEARELKENVQSNFKTEL